MPLSQVGWFAEKQTVEADVDPNTSVESEADVNKLLGNLLSHGTPYIDTGSLTITNTPSHARKGGVGKKKTPQVIKEKKKLRKKQDVPIEEEDTQIVKKLTKPKVKKVKKLTENK